MIVKLIFMDDLTQSYAHLDYNSKLSSAEALITGLSLNRDEDDKEETGENEQNND